MYQSSVILTEDTTFIKYLENTYSQDIYSCRIITLLEACCWAYLIQVPTTIVLL